MFLSNHLSWYRDTFAAPRVGRVTHMQELIASTLHRLQADNTGRKQPAFIPTGNDSAPLPFSPIYTFLFGGMVDWPGFLTHAFAAFLKSIAHPLRLPWAPRRRSGCSQKCGRVSSLRPKILGQTPSLGRFVAWNLTKDRGKPSTLAWRSRDRRLSRYKYINNNL